MAERETTPGATSPASTRRRTLPLIALALGVLLAGGGGILFPVPTVVVVIGLGVTVATVLRPWIGIAILVIALPFNGLISQLIGPGIPSLLFGALKDVILALLLIVTVVSGRFKRIPIELVVIIGLLVGLGAASAVWTPNFEQAAYGWRNDFEPLLLLLCIPALLTDRSRRVIAHLMSYVLQLTSLIAVVTWTRGVTWLYEIGRLPVEEGERFPSSLFTANNPVPRAFSPYVAPNEMAVTTAMLLAVVWTCNDWTWRKRALFSILPVAAIALSSSRSGLIGLVALAGLLILRELHQRFPRAAWSVVVGTAALGAAAVGGYIAYQLTHQSDPSIQGHADSLLDSLPYLWQHPFGVGLGQVGPRAYRYMDEALHVESFWLLLALEAGVLVLILFVVLLTRLTILGLRAGTVCAFVIPAAIGASLVSQLVLPTLQEGAVSYTLWIIVGLGLATLLKPAPGDLPAADPAAADSAAASAEDAAVAADSQG